MEREYLVDVIGTQLIDNEKEKIELTTLCSYTKKNDKYYITYEEYEENDIYLKTVSTIKVEGNIRVTLIKSGKINSRLLLEKDKRHQCLYHTQFGDLMVGVSTNEISSSLGEDGGILEISYSLDINSGLTSLNTIYVKVRKGTNNNVDDSI